MIRRPPRSTLDRSSAASDVYKRQGLYTIHERKRAAELLTHLQLLIDFKPDCFWFVVLDNASAHTTPAVEAFACQHRHRLELVYLPTYSPHLHLCLLYTSDAADDRSSGDPGGRRNIKKKKMEKYK